MRCPRRHVKVNRRETPRIAFWGKDTASHYSSLQREFAAMGVPVTFHQPSTRGYSNLPDTAIRRILDVVFRILAKAGGMLENSAGIALSARVASKIGELAIQLARGVERVEGWVDALYLCRSHDVLVFSFGRTATDTTLELRLYRLLRRRVVFVFHGSDARPPYLNEAYAPEGEAIDWDRLHQVTVEVATRIRRIDRYASTVLAYPAIAHFFTRELVDWYAMGKPLTLPPFDRISLQRPDPRGTDSGRAFRVGHAPTRPTTKGTPVLAACIEQLREEGWNIELVTTPGIVKKRDMLSLLSSCDLTVDQLWADVPGATLAAELAALGMPVIVGVRELDYFTALYPERARAMNFFDASELRETLIAAMVASIAGLDTPPKLFGDPPGVVARRYLDVFSGQDASEWMFSALGIHNLFGFGPVDRVAEIVRGYVERFGPDALHLDHRHALRDRVLELAGASAERPPGLPPLLHSQA